MTEAISGIPLKREGVAITARRGHKRVVSTSAVAAHRFVNLATPSRHETTACQQNKRVDVRKSEFATCYHAGRPLNDSPTPATPRRQLDFYA